MLYHEKVTNHVTFQNTLGNVNLGPSELHSMPRPALCGVDLNDQGTYVIGGNVGKGQLKIHTCGVIANTTEDINNVISLSQDKGACLESGTFIDSLWSKFFKWF